MATYAIGPDIRRRHAQRVAAGLLPAVLDLPSMSPARRKEFFRDVAQRGLTGELDEILEEEMEVDAAGARDLADEDPIQADQCRRRAAGWRAARRNLRARTLRPSTLTRVVTSCARPRAKRSRRRAKARGPDGGEGPSADGDPPPRPALRVTPWRPTSSEADTWIDALARALIAATRRPS